MVKLPHIIMAKERTRIINLYVRSGAIGSIFKVLRGDKSDYDFSNLAELRQLLNNEKAKILNTIKDRSPDSIYQLAKMLDRDFKSVSDDVKLLEKFGFLSFKHNSKGKRKMLKPEIIIENLQINISF